MKRSVKTNQRMTATEHVSTNSIKRSANLDHGLRRPDNLARLRDAWKGMRAQGISWISI